MSRIENAREKSFILGNGWPLSFTGDRPACDVSEDLRKDGAEMLWKRDAVGVKSSGSANVVAAAPVDGGPEEDGPFFGMWRACMTTRPEILGQALERPFLRHCHRLMRATGFKSIVRLAILHSPGNKPKWLSIAPFNNDWVPEDIVPILPVHMSRTTQNLVSSICNYANQNVSLLGNRLRSGRVANRLAA
jgi:hypothetical protein